MRIIEESPAQLNLFTPSFGLGPHSLVGRQPLIDDLIEGFAAGPSDLRFSSMLFGCRGSGKTVVLNEIADVANRSGWIVLRLDALDTTTSILSDRLQERIDWALDHYENLDLQDSPAVKTTSRIASAKLAGVGFEGRRETVRDARPNLGTWRQIEEIGKLAQERGIGVLITIDELHTGDVVELRGFAHNLQLVLKHDRLPIAFVGAALGEFRDMYGNDPQMTFFYRCNDYEMAPISDSDAKLCLHRTVSDAGGRFENGVAHRLAAAAGPLPYEVQLLGHYAWLFAGAPDNSIDMAAAEMAIESAHEEMAKRLYLPIWHGLTTTEQACIETVVLSDDGANAAQIMSAHGLSRKTVTRNCYRLALAGCLERHGKRYRLGPALSNDVIADEVDFTGDSTSAATTAPSSISQIVPIQRIPCGKMMPRAKAPCILPRNHSGGCRSK